MNSNIISNNYKKTISEKINYPRCASVEEKFNNPRFSHNLEKEYLDVKFIVKNSVEKINTLFNNEEFKQKTSSKKVYNNLANKINVNRIDLNKENINTIKDSANNTQREKENQLTKFAVNEEDEYTYDSNDLFKELKELNSNKNNNKFKIKSGNSNDIDSANGSLLNLESNKLYSKKERNINLKKINVSESANVSIKHKDKKLKNSFISNHLKTENPNDIISAKDKKKDTLKYVHKGNNNKTKKMKQYNIDLKTRNKNKKKVIFEKCTEDETAKLSNTLRLKKMNNNSSHKDINKIKKNNSNTLLLEELFNINSEINNLNTNNTIDKRPNKEDFKLSTSTGKRLYKGEKGEKKILSITDSCKNVENINNKRFSIGLKNKKNNNENNLIKFRPKKKTEKIKTQDFMKMMLILNEYLIANNLFEDYSNCENKKIIDDYSIFLANNIKNNNIKPNIITNDNKINDAASKIQRKWRKLKVEKYLINNFMEEDSELKKMILNEIMEKSKIENNKILDIFNNVIDNCKLINNNIEDNNNIFSKIQNVIKRKLTINEENLLYKEYINKVIGNK